MKCQTASRSSKKWNEATRRSKLAFRKLSRTLQPESCLILLDELTIVDFSALMLRRPWKFTRSRSPTGKRDLCMNANLNIYTAATVLVEKYGAHAAIKATTYADDFLEKGNATMAGVWQAFVAGVDELQRRRRPKN